MQVLRKLLKHTVEGNTETNVFERIEQEVLTDQEVQELIDQFGDDPEGAYDVYGMMFDFSEELCGIDLEKLAAGLKDCLSNKEDEECPTLREIAKKIESFKAYYLDFEEEKTGDKDG